MKFIVTLVIVAIITNTLTINIMLKRIESLENQSVYLKKTHSTR